MRLLDTYATNTGSKIDRPFIYTKYFPLPQQEYITIQSQTPYDSRNYSYWQEVINLLQPFLSKANICIVQVGTKDEKQLASEEFENKWGTVFEFLSIKKKMTRIYILILIIRRIFLVLICFY